jgi:hypothetical protein
MNYQRQIDATAVPGSAGAYDDEYLSSANQMLIAAY